MSGLSLVSLEVLEKAKAPRVSEFMLGICRVQSETEMFVVFFELWYYVQLKLQKPGGHHGCI